MTRFIKRIAVITGVMLAAVAPALGAADEDEAVLRARAELSRRLESVGAAGGIAVRDGSAMPLSSAPALRLSDTEGCLTPDMISRAEAALGPNRASSLDALRGALLSDDQADRSRAEFDLARAYLVLGFAAEARAIAAARSGAEAAGIAGLAMLAEGEVQDAAAAVAPFASCGALYQLVIDAGRTLRDAAYRLPDRSIEALKRLPAPLRRPIAEALAIKALEAGDAALGDYIAVAGDSRPATTSSAGALLGAVADQSDTSAATATLTSIGATPGPLRAVALSVLAERVDTDAPPDIAAALDADMAEAAESAPLSQTLSALNLKLAGRRIARRDFPGAARALGVAYRDHRTRDAAARDFAAMMRPLVSSANADDRLAAMAAAASEPELAAAALPAPDLRAAATSLADLGAVDHVTTLVSSARLNAAEKVFISSQALVRAGKVAEGRALALQQAGDARIAGILFRTAFNRGEAAVKIDAPTAQEIGAAVISGALWRTGDFAALRSMTLPAAADPATLTRMVLAFLESHETPPHSVLTAAAAVEGASHAFKPAPDISRSSARDIEKFSQRLRSEIAFLRRVTDDE